MTQVTIHRRRWWRPYLDSRRWWATRGWSGLAGIAYLFMASQFSSRYLDGPVTDWARTWFGIGGLALWALAAQPDRRKMRAFAAGLATMGPTTRGFTVLFGVGPTATTSRPGQLIAFSAWLLIALFVGLLAVFSEPYADRRG